MHIVICTLNSHQFGGREDYGVLQILVSIGIIPVLVVASVAKVREGKAELMHDLRTISSRDLSVYANPMDAEPAGGEEKEEEPE